MGTILVDGEPIGECDVEFREIGPVERELRAQASVLIEDGVGKNHWFPNLHWHLLTESARFAYSRVIRPWGFLAVSLDDWSDAIEAAEALGL